MKTIRHLLLLTLLVAAASLAHAQGDAPYNEGSVWDITTVKTKTGLQDDYLKQLKTIFIGELDEAKKQGFVLSYKILIGQAAMAGDYDVMLLIEYKNFAANDGMRAKFDAIDRKVLGTAEQQRDATVKRLEIREILGEKQMQEVTLK